MEVSSTEIGVCLLSVATEPHLGTLEKPDFIHGQWRLRFLSLIVNDFFTAHKMPSELSRSHQSSRPIIYFILNDPIQKDVYDST